MARLIYAIVVGLVGAGIIHILVLLLMPRMVETDSWTVLSGLGEPYSMIRLDGSQPAMAIADGDPLFLKAACLFDLADGPVRLHASGSVPFWSASIYDHSGLNVFSLNDRTSSDRRMDVVIATANQMIALRNNLPDAFSESVFIENELGRGITILRGFVPDPSWEPEIAAFLESAQCTSH